MKPIERCEMGKKKGGARGLNGGRGKSNERQYPAIRGTKSSAAAVSGSHGKGCRIYGGSGVGG